MNNAPFTAIRFHEAQANLLRMGFQCRGGVYPNSNANGNDVISWTANFRRGNETFCLSAVTVDDLPKLLTPAAYTAWCMATGAADEFMGVEMTHLTPSERRDLAGLGISLSETRDRKIVGTYPAYLRAQELRERVMAKRK